MPFRQIELPGVGRRVSNVMGALSSSDARSREVGLEDYYRRGGNCLHLHGEGGETHSRIAVGKRLARNGRRSRFYLCTRICHDNWDEVNQRSIDRFTPEGVHTDISTDLNLLDTEYIDLVYLDDSPESDFAPVLRSLAEEIDRGRIRAYGVRNWSPARIRAAIEFVHAHAMPPISAIVTTELSLLTPTQPLWPGYVPFDRQMRRIVEEFGLTVFAHIDDFTQGQRLLGDEDDLSRMRPEWIARWETPDNRELAARIQTYAADLGLTAREVNIACTLNQPFPVIGILGLVSGLYRRSAEYERSSNAVIERL